MRRLLLLRHAKAAAADEPLTDNARPLTERGERDARQIGERLRQHHPPPDLILSSTATRALQTAQLVASALAYSRDAIALERRLYLAEPIMLLDVIEEQSSEISCLLVVAHNPGLTELVHGLLSDFEVDDLPTAAVVGIGQPDTENWADLQNRRSHLTYYDFPKNLRDPITDR
jgi:phosphohistidine phosphatase